MPKTLNHFDVMCKFTDYSAKERKIKTNHSPEGNSKIQNISNPPRISTKNPYIVSPNLSGARP